MRGGGGRELGLEICTSPYRSAWVFCLMTKVSGASHGIVVTPPTSLAGVDCEARYEVAFG